MYLSLVTSQGGGIHSEEEFHPFIRVCFLFSPGNDNKFCPNSSFIVKNYSRLILYLEIGC